ncbi:MAG TPA: MoxR family ATPase [Candidatus Cottocaccamicrobium excrementipullorum]|nr:MoxR family ATPase [Candidatus Cottocaccamicrobium excrementipullorum]
MEHKLQEICQAVSLVVVGQERTRDLILAAFLAGGHVLMEDLPGTGKTLMAKTLAKTMDMEFGRVQFTPDLMPSDVTGIHYYNQKAGEFQFKKGPVFSNILLADEINRAAPRTQSSLLEAMEERQVTIDGESWALPDPFFVIATQNPVESAGTFPLPEAQMDRFLMKIGTGLPNREQEKMILRRFAQRQENPYRELKPVCSHQEFIALMRKAEEVYIHPQLLDYVVEIVAATRENKTLDITAGASPRGSLALLRSAKALALVKGREYVTPEEIKELAVPVLAHRLVLPGIYGQNAAPQEIIRRILSQVPVPTEEWDR